MPVVNSHGPENYEFNPTKGEKKHQIQIKYVQTECTPTKLPTQHSLTVRRTLPKLIKPKSKSIGINGQSYPCRLGKHKCGQIVKQDQGQRGNFDL